ncbi:hypothetical protein ACFX2J_046033 [Malus domestica]
MTYSLKRTMTELRHSIPMRARATSSPIKRDEDSSLFISNTQPQDDDDSHGRPSLQRSRPSFPLLENPYSATTSWNPCAKRCEIPI